MPCQVRSLRKLKLNFCDYFGDEALRELAGGRPARTLEDIVSCLSMVLEISKKNSWLTCASSMSDRTGAYLSNVALIVAGRREKYLST